MDSTKIYEKNRISFISSRGNTNYKPIFCIYFIIGTIIITGSILFFLNCKMTLYFVRNLV